ncbi:hypothetical protein [Sinorhizobium psoraleae]|uniref:hypothetical protein n=1 Tax=Sinorhizobium psoraleae TaxID=520838 RepID=UPI001567EA99|nr:hypothetical protein [Sinorhizobium psoraleae]
MSRIVGRLRRRVQPAIVVTPPRTTGAFHRLLETVKRFNPLSRRNSGLLHTFRELLFKTTQFPTENRCTLFLELLFKTTQFPTENRCTLFLELLFKTTQFPTENRCTLFLELLFKTTQFPTENRCTLFLELLSAAPRGSG